MISLFPRLQIFLIASFMLLGCSPHSSTSNVGVLKPNEEMEFNLGTVKLNGGEIASEISFKNDSDEHLYIHKAVSSCDCIEGRIFVKGRSYQLSTIEKLITERIIIAPHYPEITVHIDYDPTYHGIGSIDKHEEKITLYTSSRVDGEITKPFNEKFSYTEISVVGEVVE